MHKTTVYLNDEEVQALRQLAAMTGRSQADLIREAIRNASAEAPPRRFRSLGKGASSGRTARRWNPTDLYTRRLPPGTDSNPGADADSGRH